MPCGYRSLESLGGVTTDEVYLAEHPTLASKRVIKMDRNDTTRAVLLRQEAEILLQIKHPQIPEIYDYGKDGDITYLVEEYMEGLSLQTYLSDHNSPNPEWVCELGIALCDILGYLHNLQPAIYYLDLKPKHILLKDNMVFLVDFGSAKRSDAMNHGLPICGMKGFAAPEIWERTELSAATDIYELGALMHYALYGEFYSSDIIPGNRTELDGVIQKACRRNPSERYSNIFQFKNELLKLKEKNISTGEANCCPSQIAVIASEPHIGATHTAMKLTMYFNRHHQPACYYSLSNTNALNSILNSEKRCRLEKDTGRIYLGDFIGNQLYRKNEAQKRQEIQVIDCGVLRKELLPLLEEADVILAIIGAKPWEQENALRLMKEVRDRDNAKILVNYTGPSGGRAFVRNCGVSAAFLPRGEDVFGLTMEENRFFTAMWKKQKKGVKG